MPACLGSRSSFTGNSLLPLEVSTHSKRNRPGQARNASRAICPGSLSTFRISTSGQVLLITAEGRRRVIVNSRGRFGQRTMARVGSRFQAGLTLRWS